MKKGLTGLILSLLLVLAVVFGVLYISSVRQNDETVRELRASLA